MSGTGIEEKVIGVLAEALDRDAASIRLHDSLIDDLGAESIDFLDIQFQLEAAFGVKLPADDIWKGDLERADPAAVAAHLGVLRERMPDFDWERFPKAPQASDLPRLITPRTIVEYMRRTLGTT
jgi:acyl carrier protein